MSELVEGSVDTPKALLVISTEAEGVVEKSSPSRSNPDYELLSKNVNYESFTKSFLLILSPILDTIYSSLSLSSL